MGGRWQAVGAVTAVAAAAHPLESIRSSTVLQVITAKDFHVARCTLHVAHATLALLFIRALLAPVCLC